MTEPFAQSLTVPQGGDESPPPPPPPPDPGSPDTAVTQMSINEVGVPNVMQTEISRVTFQGTVPAKTVDSKMTNSSSSSKITRNDVKKIFTKSTTKGTVNLEQIRRIKQMHDKISDGVDFNFNYYNLLIVASVVAGLGLVSDSSTTVISSMLLSPIMGPVIGLSYGLVIWDIDLIKRSAKNEILSIIICIFFGVMIGLTTGWTNMADSWATGEMLSRGTKQTFLIGIPIAFFSGLGVALSVLDDQTSSLVGVAISASLLPPAVNCGILWMFAAMVRADFKKFDNDGDGDEDFVKMGGISLALTVANIIVVWLAAAFMFRMKEVLPVKKKVFWDDLKVARRIYQNRAVLEETNEMVAAADYIPRRPDVDVKRHFAEVAEIIQLIPSKDNEEEKQADIEMGIEQVVTRSLSD